MCVPHSELWETPGHVPLTRENVRNPGSRKILSVFNMRNKNGKFEELLEQGFHEVASISGDRADISETLDDKAPMCLQKAMG